MAWVLTTYRNGSDCTLMTDLRHAVRTLIRQPGATTVVVLTHRCRDRGDDSHLQRDRPGLGIHPGRQQGGTGLRRLDRHPRGSGARQHAKRRAPHSASPCLISPTGPRVRRPSNSSPAFEMGSVNLTGVGFPMRIASVRVTANLVALWGITPIAWSSLQTRRRTCRRNCR